MIVQLRGTNGSGKSWVVHELLKGETHVEIELRGVRFLIIVGRNTVSPGHYRINNGGMDTINHKLRLSAEDLIRKIAVEIGGNVLMEGNNRRADTDFVIGLHSCADVEVIHLTTPLVQCVRQVRDRGHTLSEDSIGQTFRKCEREADVLERAGVKVHRLSSEEALGKTREILGWT